MGGAEQDQMTTPPTGAVSHIAATPPSAAFVSVAKHVFRFDIHHDAWVIVDGGDGPVLHTPRAVRLATFNVLADSDSWYMQMTTASKKRRESLSPLIHDIDADVLALHDVSAKVLSELLADEWIRQSYVVTTLPRMIAHGHTTSVLLSRLPVRHGAEVGIGRREAPVIVVAIPPSATDTTPREVAIAAFHGPEGSDAASQQLRSELLTSFVPHVQSLLPADQQNEVCILGDFGFETPEDEAAIGAAGLLDAWAETHFAVGEDQNPGNTLDSALNLMVRHVTPNASQRHRPDRILIHAGCHLSPAASATLWATQALPAMDALDGDAGPVQQLTGLFRRRTFDVYPSTHFGVAIDLKTGRPFEGDAHVGEVAAELALAARPYVSRTHIVDDAFAYAEHSAWLLARCIGQR
jgi:hypothetical protein